MTADLADRLSRNPLIRPQDVPPSRPGFQVDCVLNPGAFEYQGRIGLLLRVAERPAQEPDWISTPILDPAAEGGMRILRVRRDDPALQAGDSRVFSWQGACYLTTLSHLRLAWSDDGERFTVEPRPLLVGEGPLESYGLEDCRVTTLEDRFLLTYTAVSACGVGVGCMITRDWRRFERLGMILPPHNKDCAILPERIGGDWFALHRPSGHGLGGNDIWSARSPDLRHWGDHRCIARCRPGGWDGERIGAGAAPVLTDQGWLELYHGSDGRRYCLGGLLLDRKDPDRVLARSRTPVMEPLADCERRGFWGEVVFTNGHVRRGDELLVYYGAADAVVCGARLSLHRILDSLEPVR